eukprot:2391585-Rhodomonas_salina.1
MQEPSATQKLLCTRGRRRSRRCCSLRRCYSARGGGKGGLDGAQAARDGATAHWTCGVEMRDGLVRLVGFKALLAALSPRQHAGPAHDVLARQHHHRCSHTPPLLQAARALLVVAAPLPASLCPPVEASDLAMLCLCSLRPALLGRLSQRRAPSRLPRTPHHDTTAATPHTPCHTAPCTQHHGPEPHTKNAQHTGDDNSVASRCSRASCRTRSSRHSRPPSDGPRAAGLAASL